MNFSYRLTVKVVTSLWLFYYQPTEFNNKHYYYYFDILIARKEKAYTVYSYLLAPILIKKNSMPASEFPCVRCLEVAIFLAY